MSGVRTEPCLHCGKLFDCKSKLKRHEVVHTKAKPFKCQYCGKGFAQQSSVSVHIATLHQGSASKSRTHSPSPSVSGLDELKVDDV